MNLVLAFILGTPKFKRYAPLLQKFLVEYKNPATRPAAIRRAEEGIARMEEEVWVNNPMDMFIELAILRWMVEEKTIHHRDTLDLESAEAQDVQLFDTDITNSGEHVCNLIEGGRMAKNEAFFMNGISFDFLQDCSKAEADRLEEGAMYKIKVNSQEIYSNKLNQIGSLYQMKPERLFSGQGAAASADTAWWLRGSGEPTFFNRFIRFGQDRDFEHVLECQDVIAQAVDCDIYAVMHGIYTKQIR